jgi:hypothetical protein
MKNLTMLGGALLNTQSVTPAPSPGSVPAVRRRGVPTSPSVGLSSHQIARRVPRPFAGAKQGGHDRADRNANDLGDLFVRQPFQFA